MADELAADGNVDGRLLLVSCDDPHLHRQMPIHEVVVPGILHTVHHQESEGKEAGSSDAGALQHMHTSWCHSHTQCDSRAFQADVTRMCLASCETQEPPEGLLLPIRRVC